MYRLQQILSIPSYLARALSSSELTARNVFALAIKNVLDRVTSKPSLFRSRVQDFTIDSYVSDNSI